MWYSFPRVMVLSLPPYLHEIFIRVRTAISTETVILQHDIVYWAMRKFIQVGVTLSVTTLCKCGSIPQQRELARGGHLHVACLSVYDRNQNGIKQSTFSLGADQEIKMNSEQLTPTNQLVFSHRGAWLRF